MAPDATSDHCSAIRNGGFMVRLYPRPGQRAQRAAAIRDLGLIVRAAFNRSENFEPLFAAICDGLRPHDEQPF